MATADGLFQPLAQGDKTIWLGRAHGVNGMSFAFLFSTFDFGFAHEAEGVETMRWRSDRQAASLEWL